jgi:hypothetical protein
MASVIRIWRRHAPSGGGWFGTRLGDHVRVRWFRWYLLYPRMCIAAAGYAVMAIFAFGYGLAWLIGMPIAHAVVAGVVAAAPVIIAVIGERVTGIKAFGVQLNLTEVAAPMAGDNRAVAADLSEVMGQGIDTSVVDSSSSSPGLSGPMDELVRKKSKLVQIDLRNNAYWWPTRLFLVAALAQDYTDVEALVFVRSRGEQIFVGIAAPRDVRRRLARTFSSSNYESAYRRARRGTASATADAGDAIAAIIDKWPAAIGEFVSESTADTVSSSALQRWMQDDLDIQSVPSGPLTPHQRFRIVSRPRRYTALTTGERLDQVVDRNEVVAAAQMERRFGTTTGGDVTLDDGVRPA